MTRFEMSDKITSQNELLEKIIDIAYYDYELSLEAGTTKDGELCLTGFDYWSELEDVTGAVTEHFDGAYDDAYFLARLSTSNSRVWSNIGDGDKPFTVEEYFEGANFNDDCLIAPVIEEDTDFYADQYREIFEDYATDEDYDELESRLSSLNALVLRIAELQIEGNETMIIENENIGISEKTVVENEMIGYSFEQYRKDVQVTTGLIFVDDPTLYDSE